MKMTDRRTLLVLTSLIAAMTVASGALMALRPHAAPSARLIPLSAVAPAWSPRTDDPLASQVAPAAGRWQAIVIHDSASPTGSAATLDERHRRAGLGELGYHFVVGNGGGSGDGQIENSRRWRDQLEGAHSGGPHGQWYNQHALGICLVGDGDRQAPTSAQLEQLVYLVRELQRRLGVPAENVVLSYGSGDTEQSGFPAAWFRRQLLQSPAGGTIQP